LLDRDRPVTQHFVSVKRDEEEKLVQDPVVRELAWGIHFPLKKLKASCARFGRIQSQQSVLQYVLNEFAWDDDHEKMHERLLWALFIFRGVIRVDRDNKTDLILAELITRLSRYFHFETEDTRRAKALLEVMLQRLSSIPQPAPSGVRRSKSPPSGELSCVTG
jgi:hypothetical protein